MIPPFKLYFYPFLLCISNRKEKKLFLIAKEIADFFNLSSDDLKEMTKQRSSSKHQSRVNYCATYLKKLGLVTSKPKGIYTITDKGLMMLEKKGDKLTRDDLKVLPEYINMQINKDNPDVSGEYLVGVLKDILS